jgi:hypothetical protein
MGLAVHYGSGYKTVANAEPNFNVLIGQGDSRGVPGYSLVRDGLGGLSEKPLATQ